MSMYDGCFDYNNPPSIAWDHLPPFVQDCEEEIKGWSIPLEVWDPKLPPYLWYWTEKSGYYGMYGFNGREEYIEPRPGFHPMPRVRESELNRNAKRYAVSFFFVWEADK